MQGLGRPFAVLLPPQPELTASQSLICSFDLTVLLVHWRFGCTAKRPLWRTRKRTIGLAEGIAQPLRPMERGALLLCSFRCGRSQWYTG